MEAASRPERGGALLAVLWLSAALAAIAFSLAAMVRSETERASVELDGARAQYLARGAVERAMLYMQWAPFYGAAEGISPYFNPWTTELHFSFPSGEAIVEALPESSKLNVNQASAEELVRLMTALGAPLEQAAEAAQAIVDWRSAPRGGGLTGFDRYYLSLTPSFQSRHASFQEVEELLLVKGITTDLFYGSVRYDADGQPSWSPGLRDCLSVRAPAALIDVNTAPPPVLAAAGLSARAIETIVAARRARPLRSVQDIQALNLPEQATARLSVGGAGVYTLRATARLRASDGSLSDLRRSAAAMVFLGDALTGYQVLRWQDRAWAGWEKEWTRGAF